MDDLNVTQFRCSLRHRPYQMLRRGGNAVDKNAVAGFDALNGLFCGGVLDHFGAVGYSLRRVILQYLRSKFRAEL